MNKIYPISLLSLITVIGFTTTAFSQHTKVKTITIVNGDTSISEKSIDDTELADLDKQITMEFNDDQKSGKKIVKSITINSDKDGEGSNAYAYAFSDSNDKDADIEVSTDAKGNTTKIIIKKDDRKSGSKEDKKVIRKSITVSDDKTSEESMNLNINVKNTTATIDVETGNSDPLNISILDENGKQVFYDSQKDGSKYSKEIKLEKKGTYFLNLIQNKKSTTEKIIVK